MSDLSAVGAVMECQRRGIAMPDDLAIAGFGDFETGTQIKPSLTTVHIDGVGIGPEDSAAYMKLFDVGRGPSADGQA